MKVSEKRLKDKKKKKKQLSEERLVLDKLLLQSTKLQECINSLKEESYKDQFPQANYKQGVVINDCKTIRTSPPGETAKVVDLSPPKQQEQNDSVMHDSMELYVLHSPLRPFPLGNNETQISQKDTVEQNDENNSYDHSRQRNEDHNLCPQSEFQRTIASEDVLVIESSDDENLTVFDISEMGVYDTMPIQEKCEKIERLILKEEQRVKDYSRTVWEGDKFVQNRIKDAICDELTSEHLRYKTEMKQIQRDNTIRCTTFQKENPVNPMLLNDREQLVNDMKKKLKQKRTKRDKLCKTLEINNKAKRDKEIGIQTIHHKARLKSSHQEKDHKIQYILKERDRKIEGARVVFEDKKRSYRQEFLTQKSKLDNECKMKDQIKFALKEADMKIEGARLVFEDNKRSYRQEFLKQKRMLTKEYGEKQRQECDRYESEKSKVVKKYRAIVNKESNRLKKVLLLEESKILREYSPGIKKLNRQIRLEIERLERAYLVFTNSLQETEKMEKEKAKSNHDKERQTLFKKMHKQCDNAYVNSLKRIEKFSKRLHCYKALAEKLKGSERNKQKKE